ncbi:MAG: M48 family metalloprotease [Cardiobacteriaceae bacterium]|nr:M48 family metalloprotease [Cardiobacteriaceae bacterium]
MSEKTLFEERHRIARNNSRKLAFSFYLGVILSSAVYYVITFLVSVLISKSAAIANFYAIISALICSFIVLFNYFYTLWQQKKLYATDLAVAIGAIPLSEYKLSDGEYFTNEFNDAEIKKISNVVAEISVAANIKEPKTLFMPDDNSINAFVLSGKKHSMALVVSRGLIEYLDRDEQQAVIAHEVGHIVNGDCFLYSHLSAMLKGFFAAKSYLDIELFPDDDANRRYTSSQELEEDVINRVQIFLLMRAFWFFLVLKKLLAMTSSVLIFYGKKLQNKFSIEREKMADAKSIEYTRNNKSFTSALKKSLALQQLNYTRFMMPNNMTHHLFLNYQDNNTHPSTKSRIETYGDLVDDNEIELLAYKLEEQRTNKLKELKNKTVKNDKEKRENNLNNLNNLKDENYFAAAGIVPAMLVKNKTDEFKQNQNIKNNLERILALFLLSSEIDKSSLYENPPIDENKYNLRKIIANFEQVQNLPPIERFPDFIKNLSTCEKETVCNLREDIVKIISLDNAFSLNECFYYSAYEIQIADDDKNLSYKDCAEEIAFFFSWIAALAEVKNYRPMADEENPEREKIYNSLIQNAVTNHHSLPNYKTPSGDKNNIIKLWRAILAINKLKSAQKNNLLSTVNNYFQNKKHLSIPEANLQYLCSFMQQKK